MDPRDIEIRRRLDKLKEPISEIPTEEEIRRRLDNLKEISTSAISNKYVLLEKPKSNAQQIDDLMKQYSEELSLGGHEGGGGGGGGGGSTRTPSEMEVEQRLSNLKYDKVIPPNIRTIVQPNQESETKLFLRKILTQAALEKKTELQFPQFSKDTASAEKMDCEDSDAYYEEFCYICDKRPIWICRACDNNVFCNKCFKEYHEEIDERHSKKPYERVSHQYSDSDDSG